MFDSFKRFKEMRKELEIRDQRITDLEKAVEYLKKYADNVEKEVREGLNKSE